MLKTQIIHKNGSVMKISYFELQLTGKELQRNADAQQYRQRVRSLPSLIPKRKKINFILTWTCCWLHHSLGHWWLQDERGKPLKIITEGNQYNRTDSHWTHSIPSPYDAIVRGDERSFCATEAISFAVTPSTVFKKCSTGFLQNKRHFRRKTYN